MQKNLAVAALLLCGGFPMQSAAQGSLRYTVQLEDLQEVAQRLELRAPGWRLLAVERGAAMEPEAFAFGLACPWGALGPLEPRGLLRELADPLGYSPGSEVFAEQAGFRLEGSLAGAPRRGLWLEPFPGSLGLFALGIPAESGEVLNAGLFGPLEQVQAGGAGRIRRPAAEAEALVLFSLPARAAPASGEQDWMDELPSFPGGALAHLGGRLRLEAAEGRLACTLVGAASGGQRVAPGLFGLGTLEAAGISWNAQGLLGACSPDYRIPEGGLYPGAWAAGLRVEILPRPAWRFAGGWRRWSDRLPAAPDRHLPGTEEGELSVRLEVPLAAGGRLEAKAEVLARVRYAADGGVEPSARGGLAAGLSGKRGSIGLNLQGSWKEEEGELRGFFCGQNGKVWLQVGAAGQLPQTEAGSGHSLRPFGRLELAGEAFLFWMSAGSGDSGKEVSLGWSVTQALCVSPTSKTSRSRR